MDDVYGGWLLEEPTLWLIKWEELINKVEQWNELF